MEYNGIEPVKPSNKKTGRGSTVQNRMKLSQENKNYEN
jgi:hypothetical protein